MTGVSRVGRRVVVHRPGEVIHRVIHRLGRGGADSAAIRGMGWRSFPQIGVRLSTGGAPTHSLRTPSERAESARSSADSGLQAYHSQRKRDGPELELRTAPNRTGPRQHAYDDKEDGTADMSLAATPMPKADRPVRGNLIAAAEGLLAASVEMDEYATRLRVRAVAGARDAGMTWGDIAGMLDMHPSACRSAYERAARR